MSFLVLIESVRRMFGATGAMIDAMVPQLVVNVSNTHTKTIRATGILGYSTKYSTRLSAFLRDLLHDKQILVLTKCP